LLVCGALLGCTGGAASADHLAEDALRATFPAQAANVLDAGGGFERTSARAFQRLGGTTIPAERALDVILPDEGGGAITLRTRHGFEVRVREAGMAGEGEFAGDAVTYRRADGASFWTVTPDGALEEWLHLDAGVARGPEVRATWEIAGAIVRQRGDAVEILDKNAVVRLRVTAPVAYAAGGQEVPVSLEAKGSQILLLVDARGEEVLVDPVWKSTANMAVVRYAHTATLLPGGKVLVAGGTSDAAPNPNTASAELYDPLTDTWSPAGSMSAIRSAHTATLLDNGKVLVAGGYTGSPIAGAELYDPAADTWSPAAALNIGRWGHTATLLGNGKVLVAGGQGATTELYDPVANTWTMSAPMAIARSHFAATRLNDGRVLATGNGVGSTIAELYNPGTNTWTMAAPMMIPRSWIASALLGSGKVLVTGQDASPNQHSAEIYDPAANTWSLTGPMVNEHFEERATLLGNGQVIVTGGNAPAIAERYDPVSDTWAAAGTLLAPRSWHSATLLADGRILVAGGHWAVKLASAEVSAMPGAPCAGTGDCLSGFCVDGVCCDTACDGGSCDACSIAAGAASDGTCALFTGPACTDGDACTQTDTCQAGQCVSSDQVVCGAADQCHSAGVCDPATGACAYAPKPDGSECDDSNACTMIDTCQGGVCSGTNPVMCLPPAPCHDFGACDPMTGACSSPPKGDGSTCDDGNACTQTDTCAAGTCVGGGAIECAAPDDCHETGVCDPATGACSSPEKPDGTACSAGTCNAGACIPPDGTTSNSSTGGTGGTGGSAGDTGASAANITGGCGCSVPDGQSTPRPFALVAPALFWMLRRRRRRRPDRQSTNRRDEWARQQG